MTAIDFHHHRLLDEQVLSMEQYVSAREHILSLEERTAWRMRLWVAKFKKDKKHS